MKPLLACVLAFALPSVALAQESPPLSDDATVTRAKELFENGSRLYDEGLYEEAIVAFQEAYRLSQRPGLLFNVANCYERLGKTQEALDSLNLYRAYAKADERDAIERRIAALERRIADQKAAVVVPAAAPAIEPVAPPPAPIAPRGRGFRSPLLVGVGATVAVAGGVGAGLTYAASRTYADEGDQTAYEALRPLNGGSIAASVLGVGLLVVGVLPGGRAADVAVGVGRDRLILTGSF